MIDLNSEKEIISFREFSSCNPLPIDFHDSFNYVYNKCISWDNRFPQGIDFSIMKDLFILYLIASKKFLDHRQPSHLFRLVLSMHFMQKKILRSSTFSNHERHLEFRSISTSLLFPFSSKPVIGCLIAFNAIDKYELFDEENIILALQKGLPDLRLVKDSSYSHTTQHKNLKIVYFELEKRDGIPLTLKEKAILRNNIEEKVKNSIQMLSPARFLGNNQEELYKNVLVLSQEIESVNDLPQVCINLDQETGKEIVFRITLVHVLPFHRFSLKECFLNASFIIHSELTVRSIDDHPIQAYIFYLRLPRESSLLRANGSLDFYSARKRVTSLLFSAVGEFRDFNGGIIIKQQEMLERFKERFSEMNEEDPGLIESFFYGLTPIENQAIINNKSLDSLFTYFLEHRKQKSCPESTYSFNIYQNGYEFFLIVHFMSFSTKDSVYSFLKEQSLTIHEMTYNIMECQNGVFFSCIVPKTDAIDSFVGSLRVSLNDWRQKLKNRQALKIASEYSFISLDPRIAGGEASSGDLLRLLFEGLTRFDQSGHVINATAESIDISADSLHYTFHLRTSLWNDGTTVSAYDFEYAWKKILSPDFKTSFAYLFYPIKNAKEAKEGKVPLSEIGIHVINDKTLKVELVHPAPYFLQLTANTIYAPVHRMIDQRYPQWPYQCEKNYPCNGPFELKINQPNQGYQLLKNPFYWDAPNILLDEVSITLMNPTQAIQAFDNHEVDWIGNPFGAWHPFYRADNESQVISFPNSWVYWWVFNTVHPPFNNDKLRLAFAYAIQRAQIVHDAFMPLTPAFSLLLPFGMDKRPSLFPDYDPYMARLLFSEALKELNLRLEDFPLTKLVFHEKGIREYAALSIQRQLKECFDINCELEPVSLNNLFHRMTKGDFQMGLIHWTSRLDEPVNTLNSFKSAKEEMNFSKWENPEYQKLLNLSEQELNLFKRSSYLRQAEEILSKDMPIIPLFYQPSQLLVRKNFQVNYKTPGGPFSIAKSFYKNEVS